MFRGIASSALAIAALLLGPALASLAHEASRSPVIVDTAISPPKAEEIKAALEAKAP